MQQWRVRLRIRLYGRLADAVGAETELAAPEGCSIAEVRQRLAAGNPAVTEPLRSSRAFVANQLVGDEHVVSADACVEFLPPVSGG